MHHRHQLLGDSEAQSGTTIFARGRTIGLAEGFKKSALRCGRNAYTGVFNFKPHQCMTLSFDLPRNLGRKP